jgi:glycosyltransferase involved in cell wall biosynthesis
MKILLLGEYSNVHATLAQGLRELGQDVTVVSNGDFWKDYKRDIDISRTPGKIGGLKYILRLLKILPQLKGYDIVQLINPMFVELKASRILYIYKYLRRNNGKMFLGGFGMDYYWVSTCRNEKPLRYSDFNIGDELRTNRDAMKEIKDWMGTHKEKLNRYIANDCDGIITGLYEYWVCYHPKFPDKTTFIPYPIICEPDNESKINKSYPIKIFIGINKKRSEYKGTDIMLEAAKTIADKYPDKVVLQIAENIPYEEYQDMMKGADVILDQLYSYTPSMNPLIAMSKGIICVGGGEPENYEIINENNLRPIINVLPNKEDVINKLDYLINHPENIPELKRQSIEYIHKHHDYIDVANKYLDFYKSIIQK